MFATDFHAVKQLVLVLFVDGKVRLKSQDGYLKLGPIDPWEDPWQISVFDANDYQVATLRQEIVDEPPFPRVLRTIIEDETDWATPLLGALVWLLDDIRGTHEDDDLSYD